MRLEKSKKFLRQSILLTILVVSSSCSLISTKPVPIEIPVAPQYAVCPIKPEIAGDVTPDGLNVVLPIDQAVALRNWIRDYVVCVEKNNIDRDAYIQKLINRIKAVNGGK